MKSKINEERQIRSLLNNKMLMPNRNLTTQEINIQHLIDNLEFIIKKIPAPITYTITQTLLSQPSTYTTTSTTTTQKTPSTSVG